MITRRNSYGLTSECSEKRHSRRTSRFLGFFVVLGIVFFASNGSCDTTISVEAHPTSSQVFLNPGTITVDYSLPVQFIGAEHDGSGPGSLGDHALQITIVAGAQVLAIHPVQVTDFLSAGAVATTIYKGTFSFTNPVAQYVGISSSGTFVYTPHIKFESVYPNFREWIAVNGQTAVVGGDTPPGSNSTLSPQSPPTGSQSVQSPRTTPSNIHAVIISGLSDPAKVITSPNVILTGGIVALGKNGSPPPTPSAWSPGLRVVPDYALLTGEKIPPVTPNILDVRILRQEVTADFPSPNPQPDN